MSVVASVQEAVADHRRHFSTLSSPTHAYYGNERCEQDANLSKNPFQPRWIDCVSSAKILGAKGPGAFQAEPNNRVRPRRHPFSVSRNEVKHATLWEEAYS